MKLIANRRVLAPDKHSYPFKDNNLKIKKKISTAELSSDCIDIGCPSKATT